MGFSLNYYYHFFFISTKLEQLYSTEVTINNIVEIIALNTCWVHRSATSGKCYKRCANNSEQCICTKRRVPRSKEKVTQYIYTCIYVYAYGFTYLIRYSFFLALIHNIYIFFFKIPYIFVCFCILFK